MKPLKRNLNAFAVKEYDLVIIGGGIFGVCCAWDAALRGLSVALIEKNDFSHATSANHFKMVHGGIRYLQHADLNRVRESSRERKALLRIAPHLVHPLPIVIPTYGLGVKGKPFLAAGLFLYDLLTIDRNLGLDTGSRIPIGKFLSRDRVLGLFPGLEAKGLTGAAVFCDGQVYNPPRLAISFLRSAVSMGADVANYVEAKGFINDGQKICGVHARDVINGQEFKIRAKVTLNAAGPWAHHLIKSTLGRSLEPKPTFSRDLAFVVNRRFAGNEALAISTQAKDADTILDRGGRHLFIVPWRDYSLIGVWHTVFKDLPEKISVGYSELQDFINEVNIAYPALALTVNDILTINTGLTLYGEENRQGESKLSFGKRSMLVDHGSKDSLAGLITLIGVRATTARGMAERAIDLVLKKMGNSRVPCQTAVTPIYGGQIGTIQFQKMLNESKEQIGKLPAEQTAALLHNYGSKFNHVLSYGTENPRWLKNFDNTTVLKAEVIHAVRDEMALKLADVIFRRTDLATGAMPPKNVLRECAQLMAIDLGWDQNRLQKEMKDVQNTFPRTH